MWLGMSHRAMDAGQLEAVDYGGAGELHPLWPVPPFMAVAVGFPPALDTPQAPTALNTWHGEGKEDSSQ